MFNNQGSIMESTTWQYAFKPIWQTLLGPFYSMATTFYTTSTDTGIWSVITDLGNYSLDAIIIQTMLVALILYASYNLIRDKNKTTIWLIACNSLSFIALYYAFDLYSGRTLSLVYRYHIPIMIMAIVIVGLLLGKQIDQKKTAYALLFSAFILGSGFSMLRISNDQCYHHHGNCERQFSCASELSENENALIIVGGDRWWLTYQFWELTQETESDKIDILYDPIAENIESHLNKKPYSAIYTFAVSSKLKYSLLSYYKQQPSTQPLPVSLAKVTDEFFNSIPWNKEESKMDTTIDLTQKNITINLTLDPEIQTDSVFITGSHYALGDWDPGLVQLQRISDGQWSGNFLIERGEGSIIFNFTKGDRSHYLVDSENMQIKDFSHNIVNDTTIIVKAWRWKNAGDL